MNKTEWLKSFDRYCRQDIGLSLTKLLTVMLMSEINALYEVYPDNPSQALQVINFDVPRFDTLFPS